MINILEPGKKQKKQRIIYIIICPHCGCKFECDLSDFKKLNKGFDEPMAWIDCPYCKKEIEVNRNAVKTREEDEVEE